MVVAVSAAMVPGTGLKRFGNMFPERLFDVGIAEEHAVTFAAGLAAWRVLRPVVAIYSSFPAAGGMIRSSMMYVCRICRWYLPWTGPVWWEAMERPIRACFDLSYLSMHSEYDGHGAERTNGNCRIC